MIVPCRNCAAPTALPDGYCDYCGPDIIGPGPTATSLAQIRPGVFWAYVHEDRWDKQIGAILDGSVRDTFAGYRHPWTAELPDGTPLGGFSSQAEAATALARRYDEDETP